jgi:hypothetical protein
MAIMTGLGRPDFTTIGLTQEKLLPVEPMEFEITGESEKKESKKFVDGKLVTAGTALGSTTFTMKIGIEAINWLAIQFAFGELAGTTASIALPELRYGTVPTATPYEVADADITDDLIQVSINAKGAWGEPRPLTKITGAGAPTTGQFKVDTTAKKLIFNAAEAGAPFVYRIFKTQTALPSIGAEPVFEALSAFSFSGIGHTDEGRVKIIIPKINRSSVPSISLSDVTKFELEFDLLTVGSDRFPFKMFKLS